MIAPRHQTRATAVTLPLVVIVLLGGCAVMQIDVDVYKGPMANHVDVQTEQLTALAMAAKPLLVGLRDRLEGLGEDPDKPGLRKRDGKTLGDYERDFMPKPPDTVATPWFTDEDAIRVNGILSLYKDKRDEELRPYADAADRLVRQYRTAWHAFRVSPDDHALAERVREAVDKRRPSEDIKAVTEGVARFLKGNDGFRDVTTLLESLKRRSAASTAIQKSAGQNGGEMGVEFGTANAALTTLSDRNTAHAVTRALLGSDDVVRELREELASRIVQISTSFLRARDATERLFSLTLTEIARLERIRYVHRALVLPGMIELAEGLIVRTALHDGLRIDAPPPTAAALLRRLSNYLPRDFFKDQPEADEPRKLTLMRSLHSAFSREDPAAVATELLDFHRWFRDLPDGTPPNSSYTTSAARKFGISRVAPRDTDGSSDGTQDANLVDAGRIADIVGNAILKSGIGFENGRAPHGLEDLIDRYLQGAQARRDARAGSPGGGGPDSEEVRQLVRAREDLTESLIHFSEKILFTANNQALLDGRRDDLRQYTSVLQVIGNSIIVAADELRHHDDYTDPARRKQRTGIELSGLRAGLPTDPPGILEAILTYLATHPEALTSDLPDLQQKIDAARKELEDAEQDHATRGQLSKALKDAEAKAKAANEWLDPARRMDAMIRADDFKAVRERVLGGGAPGSTTAPTNATPPTYAVLLLAFASEFSARHEAAVKANDKDKQLALATTIDVLKQLSEGTRRDSNHADPYVRLLLNIDPKQAEADRDAAAEAVAQAKQRLEQIGKTEEQLKQRIAVATEALEKARDAHSKSYQRASERLKKAVAYVRTLRDLIIAGLENSSAARLVMPTRIIAILKAAESAPPQGADPQAITDALAAMRALPPLLTVAGNDAAEDSREVIDQVVVSLRYQHIEAIRMYGKDDPFTRNLEEAIHQAETYRSGMVYIRPPSAYLRTANPASFLQQGGAERGWQNMLFRHNLRSTPLLGEKLTNAGKDTKLLHEMDRQFWQNINQVRVGAVGITNYVIAKDDVGNWYVKNYSGDPEPVIKAAKAATLYGASARVGEDLIRRNINQERAARGEQVDDQASPSIVDRQVNQFRANYVAQTNADATMVRVFAAGAPDAIKAAFDAAEPTKSQSAPLKQAIDNVAKDARFVIALPEKPDAQANDALGNQIIDTLRSVRFLQSASVAAVDGLKLEETMKVDETTTVADLRKKAEASETKRRGTAAELDALRTKEADARKALDEAQDKLHARRDELVEARLQLAKVTPNPPVDPMPLDQRDAQQKVVVKEAEVNLLAEAKTSANTTYTTAATAASDKEAQLKSDEKAANDDKKIYADALQKAKDVTAAAKKAVLTALTTRLNQLTESRFTAVKAYADAILVVRQSVAN